LKINIYFTCLGGSRIYGDELPCVNMQEENIFKPIDLQD